MPHPQSIPLPDPKKRVSPAPREPKIAYDSEEGDSAQKKRDPDEEASVKHVKEKMIPKK